MADAGSSVAIALLCARGEFGDRVRESMTALGAAVVYEVEPQAFDRDALENSRANVVVVNLDARNDAELDHVYGLLDDTRYRVIFNDDEVSAGLTGWDQARWMRHLAAKILGGADIDPPRPADAEAVPVRTTARTDRVDAVIEAAADDRAKAVADVRLDSSPEDIASKAAAPWPSISDAGTATVASAESSSQDTPDATGLPTLDDFGFDLDLSNFIAPPPLPAAPGVAEQQDDSLDVTEIGAPSAVPVAAITEPDAAYDLDLDAFFDESALSDPAPDSESTAAAGYDLAPDFIDFDELDDASSAPPVPVADPLSGWDRSEFGADTSADEASAITAVPTQEHEAANEASDAGELAATEFAAVGTQWTLEDVLDGESEAPALHDDASAFGIETLRPEAFLAPEVEVHAVHPFEVPQGISLELIPLEEAVAPEQAEPASRENWLDPDAVKAKVRHVWVLGASIGGPEAVREFLAALPRDYPALFVLAQHLGDEFVDMMAKQLAQAAALTVRTPIHGARVGHGEVVVVPNGKRMLVDAMGVVVLERDTEQRAFSPSIDCVLRDMADRFGSNAGAIIFSGMTDDAVEGCRYLAQKGGVIYAQSQDTCVVSTMIDGVCEAGIVSFQGSPRELAEKLITG